MQELLDKIIARTGISSEQASQTIDTVKDFIKEKFPMVAGAVDGLFKDDNNAAAATPSSSGGSFLDKISDVIPGSMGEKIEQFAKDNADKADGVLDSFKDKLGEILNDKK